MQLKNFHFNLELGQTILVGRNNEPAKITKIEYHKQSGEISINTTKGPRKALTFRLCDDLMTANSGALNNPADKYR
jgi:hypothetical protein